MASVCHRCGKHLASLWRAFGSVVASVVVTAFKVICKQRKTLKYLSIAMDAG